MKKVAWLFLFLGIPAHANIYVDTFLKIRDFQSAELKSQWKSISFVKLFQKAFPTFHPQGIKVIGNIAYLSTVEGTEKGFGHLIRYKMDSIAQPKRARPIDQIVFPPGINGTLIHAGGIDGDRKHIYVPLAGYNKDGPTQIMEVDTKTSAYQSIAWVDDHVGSLAFDKSSGFFHLFDWSTGVYSVPFSTLSFKHQETVAESKYELDSGWEYQDCKAVGDRYSICSAKSGNVLVEGEIHLIKFSLGHSPSLEVVHRVKVPHIQGNGKSGGRRPLTYNAMDMSLVYDHNGDRLPSGMRFYFVPHDDEETHLMVYEAKF